VATICVLAGASGCGGSGSPADPTPSASTIAATPEPTGTGAGGPAADPQPTSTGTTSGGGGGQTNAWPSPEDCVTYNPNNLTKQYAAGIWSIRDGQTEVARVHDGPAENTGDKALALAKRWKSHCFIGRDNHRTEKYSYIFDYWRNSSGVNTTIPDQESDCSGYNKNNITVDDMGDGAYRVKDHDHVLHGFDTRSDANNGKLVLAKYNQICFIGSGDDVDNMGQDQLSYML
jgi:hypothetical protein